MKLFGANYEIQFIKLQKDVDFGLTGRAFGAANSIPKIIRLWKGLRQERCYASLLKYYMHELVHMILDEQETELSEHKVNQLALGLSSWILENGIKVKIE